MASEVNLDSLGARAYAPSQRSEDKTKRLQTVLNLDSKAQVARLAIGRSLCVPDAPPPLEGSGTGTAIKGQTLLNGTDLKTWIALIVEHAGTEDYSSVSLADLVVRHWDRGCELLWREWEETSEPRYKRFIEHLAKSAALSEATEGAPGAQPSGPHLSAPLPIPVQVGEVGTIVGSTDRAIWVPNATGAAPFCAVLGKVGTGKTRTGMNIVKQIREGSGCPVLILDLKGDIAERAEYVAAADAQVIRPRDTPIPLDALSLAATTADYVELAASAFRDSLGKVVKIGPKQQMALRDSVRRLLSQRPRGISLRDIKDDVSHQYASNNQGADSLIAALDDLTSLTLLEPRLSPADFFSRSWIISMQGLPEAQVRILALLLIDALAAHILNSEEAPQDATGNKQLRFLLAIDEARLILGLKHEGLYKLVRMGRSKGLVGMFMSQSPDDFASDHADYLEQIGLPIVFNTAVDKAKMLEGLMGSKMSPLRLGGLTKGHAFVKLANRPGATEVICWS